jgi:hypothetical protein
MQHNIVADRDVSADDERMGIVRHMKHAEVLDIRPFSNPDVVDIAPDDGVEPHTAILPHDHIADHDSSLFDKA